ncbi:hypothetical protein HQ535_10305 [bacterium]|nr:hypothetical protein [bacterium]
MTQAPTIRIAVVGNCQARPLAVAIRRIVPRAEIVDTAIVHLLTDENEAEYAPTLEKSDLILSMLVADTYRCSFVRTNALRERYGDKVRVWPNLFYSGYNPELMHIRDQSHGARSGPLGEYHSRTIIEAWRKGHTAEEAVSLVRDIDHNRARYLGTPEESLAELSRREALTDLEIVDFIGENQQRERLFLTFNHPSWSLIQEAARRLAISAGLNPVAPDPQAPLPWKIPEPLGQIRLPVNAWVVSELMPQFQDETGYRGHEVPGFGRPPEMGRGHLYSLDELVAAFFDGYDQSPTGLDE